jgi:hypothetical protein
MGERDDLGDAALAALAGSVKYSAPSYCFLNVFR